MNKLFRALGSVHTDTLISSLTITMLSTVHSLVLSIILDPVQFSTFGEEHKRPVITTNTNKKENL